MKTHVLIISTKFPITHDRSGETTGFEDKILNKEKIHTIRASYKHWEKRIKEVREGKAILSVRYWTGKPYGSKQAKVIDFDSESGIGVQKIGFNSGDPLQPVMLDDRYFKHINPFMVAENDGLDVNDFKSWFKKYSLLEYHQPKPMAIIHFTSFRY